MCPPTVSHKRVHTAGVGIVLTALVGVLVFRQSLDPAAVAGIGFIALGVILINAVSGSASH